ncbi:hypothetical protein [Nocardioides cavernaquae]|uniref:Uncharacterized protein n=1 Tax=Nocardioides cavernaquae TaxID=2321396 RepID=A0A3A5H9J1_9ACTN|nr:hypothetical protein [Nocardioides cavernaquae]RJS47276.1 hypothetical protein D4739_14295 [Nocardioides cavernaquae]
MHDIDRAMFEFEQETYETGGPGETAGESYEAFEAYESFEASHEAEALEMEYAARLLEITNEAELEEFLGGLLRTATSAARSFISSPTGQALGGVLKNAARQVLPQVGGIVGNAIGGDFGRRVGSAGGRWLGKQFEYEGMSAEDREFEVARAFVRTARDAAQIAQRTAYLPPQQAARTALVTAAQRSLPGLVPVITGGSVPGPRRTSGRWVRKGNRIVLYGA